MGQTLGALLPLGVAVAISPVPLVGVLLMLLSNRARSLSLAFTLGWCLGIAVAITVFGVLAAAVWGVGAHTGSGGGGSGVARILLGLALVLLGVRSWRSSALTDAEETELPEWLTAIDTMQPRRALVLGLVSAVLPKNLVVAVSAGITLGAAGLALGQAAVVVAGYTLVAASTVLAVVVAFLVAPQRWAGPLGRLREWLVSSSDEIMAVLLVVIGAVVLGHGVAALTG